MRKASRDALLALFALLCILTIAIAYWSVPHPKTIESFYRLATTSYLASCGLIIFGSLVVRRLKVLASTLLVTGTICLIATAGWVETHGPGLP